jgi:hypothetical protein
LKPNDNIGIFPQILINSLTAMKGRRAHFICNRPVNCIFPSRPIHGEYPGTEKQILEVLHGTAIKVPFKESGILGTYDQKMEA